MTGWSYQDLAHASGDVVSKKTFNDLVMGTPKSWPTPATIAGIARALSIPDDAVVLAIAASLGVPVRAHPSLLAMQLPASADLLTPSERSHIIGLVKALTSGREAGGEVAEPDETLLGREVRDAAVDVAEEIGRRNGKGEGG
ncbi:hypothetical protein TPA4_38 [Tsukamurella phage TPA4]|uniref:transcriptional repressor n=1 Tax=Tsukamurella phage TPA4 TaxID=1647476 RepID=UPI0007B64F8D|nr:transcriptional repressor [Tsukamurella phage TPA4]AKJ72203.1 hypothetical protein TPA4_38 [Tsukamurella phage TPA4]